MAPKTQFLDAAGRRLPGEIRGGAGTLTIEAGTGNRKRFKMLAYSGGPLALRDYAHPVIVDLSGVNIEAQSMMMLAEHDEARPVGESETITITAGGIEIHGYLDADTDDGKLIHAAGKGGFAWEGSIGAPVHAMEEYAKGERVTVNGRTFSGPLYVARKTTLRETSFVKRGADTGKTHVSIAATHKGDSKMEPKFEAYITASGFDPSTLTEPQTVTLKAAFDASEKKAAKEAAKAAAGDTPTINAELQAIRAELAKDREERAEHARVADIKAKCEGHPDIAAQAITGKWTADRAELEVLRAGRPDSFNVIVRGESGREGAVQELQAAMILRAGGRLDHPSYTTVNAAASPAMPAWIRAGINTDQRQRVMERAHKLAAMSSIDLCRRCIAIDGRQVPDDRHAVIQAAFSSNSFTNVFTTSIYARLIAGFMEAPDTTAGWTQAEDVTDFKVNDDIRLITLGGVPQKLPRGNEAQHISRSDEIESFSIDRYAAQFVIDEQDVIDDRLGAFANSAPDMGRWFASIPQDIVYGILLENPTLAATGIALFSDNNSPDNLRGSSTLTAANLKLSIPAMALATENGRNLSINPTHLIVPPSLQFTAAELMNSVLIVSGDTAQRGNANVLKGMLDIVREPRLENGVTNPDSGVTSSGSASVWYLASTDARTIKRVYRAGTGRSPQIRDFQLTQGKWGKGWDINFDVGAAAMDFRGLQKNA